MSRAARGRHPSPSAGETNESRRGRAGGSLRRKAASPSSGNRSTGWSAWSRL